MSEVTSLISLEPVVLMVEVTCRTVELWKPMKSHLCSTPRGWSNSKLKNMTIKATFTTTRRCSNLASTTFTSCVAASISCSVTSTQLYSTKQLLLKWITWKCLRLRVGAFNMISKSLCRKSLLKMKAFLKKRNLFSKHSRVTPKQWSKSWLKKTSKCASYPNSSKMIRTWNKRLKLSRKTTRNSKMFSFFYQRTVSASQILVRTSWTSGLKIVNFTMPTLIRWRTKIVWLQLKSKQM